MFCPKCGAQLADGAKFCPKCGTKIGPSAQPAPAPQPSPEPVPAPHKRRDPVVAIAASLVVLVGVGAFAWFMFFSPFQIDEQTFPDASLRAAVSATYDANHDGVLSRDEGKAVTDITLSGAVSLKGLGRAFPNVSTISVTGGQLSELDISDLGNLISLSIPDEPVSSLDLSHNAKLQTLDATNAPIASLDISHNRELAHFYPSSDTSVTGVEAAGLREVWVASQIEQATEGSNYSSSTLFEVHRDKDGRVTGNALSYEYEGGNGYEKQVENSFEYDDQGRVVSEESTDYRFGSDVTDTDYAYDDAGRLVSRTSSYDSGTWSKDAYDYDDAERLVKITSSGSGSDYTSGYTYAYDNAGELASKQYFYSKSDSSSYPTTYSYDDQGHCTAETTQSEYEDKMTTSVNRYQLDANGNVVNASYETDSEYGADYVSPVNFGYDDQGRLVGATSTLSTEYSDSSYEASVAYDERGNVSQAVEKSTYSYDGDESVSTSTYTPTYVRYFVAKDAADPEMGLEIGAPRRPLTQAQVTQLLYVFSTPDLVPDPEPYAMDWNSSMIVL